MYKKFKKSVINVYRMYQKVRIKFENFRTVEGPSLYSYINIKLDFFFQYEIKLILNIRF